MMFVKQMRRVANKSFLIATLALVLFSGCSFLPRFNAKLPGNRAFIKYWPPPQNSSALKVAVKDNIDMKGVVTSAGSELLLKTHAPAEKDAPCLAIARERKVQFVGKTNMTEFAVAPSGFNEYFGTPTNPFNGWRRLIPGGSSCGSAVAVANGMADVAFGTDTAGSIRVPAACCGVVGLKTTHGLVPVDGVFPLEPEHLDTVGPMGKDIAHAAAGMDLLERGFASRYEAVQAEKPFARTIRVGRLKLKGTDPRIDEAVDAALARTGFQLVRLNDGLREKWEQAKKDGDTIAAVGAWISDRQFRYALGVTARTKTAILAGRILYRTAYRKALARQGEWQKTLAETFKNVDLIALPTLQTTPPPIPPNLKIGLLEARVLKLQNTVPVNFAGNPALAIPIPLRDAALHVTSLQLIGPRLSEAELLNAGRLVETAVKN
jgi:amidase